MRKLYNIVKPALESKKLSLHNEGYVIITKKDIFNYLSNRWDKYSEISDIVDDIMSVSGYEISKYIKEEELYRRYEL